MDGRAGQKYQCGGVVCRQAKNDVSNGGYYGTLIKLGIARNDRLCADGCCRYFDAMVDDDLSKSCLAVFKAKRVNL